MNPPEFRGSKVEEDPQRFIDEVYKVLANMGVSLEEKAELAAYQLEDVDQIWFFPRELREAKVEEFINLCQGRMSMKEYALKFTQLSKSDGQGLQRFRQRFSNQGSSSAPPRVNKDRVSNPKSQGEIKENLAYEEVPVEILDRQVKRLRNKEVASVKVLLRNHIVEGDTSEAKVDIKSRYPHLFPFTPIQA
ncbi:hypothetical protein MTR67_043760 [Solanum verrucosum]|uniref:Retrotransposon gag domain-containing protein n=1 Tax=Solanum verrucosum TaxID=315347 RepID=A0AAF0ZV10_SOLVR|nr:hypothetical protein MTR67_043760 [Solanum verrucosum]